MKKALISLIVALTGIQGYAQSVLSGSTSNSDMNGWSCAWVEWSPSTFKVDQKGADDQSFTGLSAGYSKAFSVTPTNPVFIEVGIGLQYSFYEDNFMVEEMTYDGDTYSRSAKRSLDLWSFKVPVNLLYKYDMPNSSVSIMPFAGINLRYNFIGTMHDNSIYERDANGFLIYERNLFDSGEMGGSNATWNRFQLGWNIGVKAHFAKHIMAGLTYGNDLSEIAKKTKISTTAISVGYVF